MAKKFTPPTTAEKRYAASLKKVARIVSGIVDVHLDEFGVIRNPYLLDSALASYSAALGPWAEKIAGDMIRGVSLKSRNDFISSSKMIGTNLRSMMQETSIGATAKLIQDRQVTLIKTLPLEGGLKAQKLAQEAAITGSRARETATKILSETEATTRTQAVRIARTEIAKTNAAITQARAQSIGADSYIWRTAGDADVRESHAEMEGTVQKFSDPPTLSDGETLNPGEIYNCRCYAEPIIIEIP